MSKLYMKIDEGHDLNSDHSPLYLTLCKHIIEKKHALPLINKHTDWNYFHYILQRENAHLANQIVNEQDIEKSVLKTTN